MTIVAAGCAWIESSGLSIWLRESPSFFAFPLMLSLHAIGMGLAAGLNAALALRLLGVGPDVPVLEMTRFLPVMWAGVWVNGLSGIALLIAYPTKALTNPVFYVWLVGTLARVTPVGSFMRTHWAWPAAESVHFVGLSLLVGTIVVWDLRLLGVARRIPISSAAGC